MDDLDFGSTIKGYVPGQKVLNRYKLARILGRGGMGVVWLARDEELERDVALKFLPEVVAMDAEAVADLKRETRRNLDLTHPHIVRIHDFVSDKRTAAIAMEYVDGATLAALKLERPGRVFTVAELGPWLEHALEALHYAHTKAKVVHRDLKPANLMITAGGDLKITDFGIATSITDSVSRVSKQAGASGTPVYMSPQQMMGERAAVTDDIYALGATLYELLTSKPPFFSGNVILQVQSKEVSSLAERRSELGIEAEPVPSEWESTILACLAKDPKDRPQSARELAERLGLRAKANAQRPTSNVERSVPKTESKAVQAARVAPAPAEAKGEGRKSKMPVLAGLAAGVLLLGGAGWYFGLHLPEQQRLAEAAEQRKWERAASGAGEEIGNDEKKGGVSSAKGKRSTEGPNGYVTQDVGGMGTVYISTKLWKAAYDGDLAKVRDLLAQGADINLECEPYFPGLPGAMPAQRPLQAAISKKHRAVVELLLERGAKVDSRERQAASESGDAAIADLVLKGTKPAAGVKAAAEAPKAQATASSSTPPAPASRSAVAAPRPGAKWTIADLNLDLMPIAPGTFQMGSASGDRDDERPVTRVTLTQPFWLGRTEVTQAQWEAVMGSNSSEFRGSDRPVEKVSWGEVMEFGRKLTERERTAGRLPEGYAYTLPTEAQWEYACRAGTTGDSAGDCDAMAWYAANSGFRTHPVGGKQANAWGLHDMYGNVWEWCADWSGSYAGGGVTDPAGPTSGSRRIIRGGSFDVTADSCRSADRGWNVPGFRGSALGFRLALAPMAKTAEATVAKREPAQSWENSLGQKFVPVPGTGVLFCIWEVREQDYAAFLVAAGRSPRKANAGPTHPVVNVSWDEAGVFCAWLTEKERREGRLGPAQEYRLPTDGEWDAAVGKDEFPWGSQWPPHFGTGNYDPSIDADSYEGTAPVGSFATNHYGIHDLGGNVWEHVSGRQDGARGNSFRGRFRNNLASSAMGLFSTRADDVGFRLVVTLGSVSDGKSNAPAKTELSIKLPSASRPTVGAKWTIADLDIDLMPIAPGTFQMGSATSGEWKDERPVTKVTLTKPFWLGKTEVTQAQWTAVMGSNPSYYKGDNLPVGNVSWADALEFCRKLMERERAAGRLSDGYIYTLPTEAQWEYACRAGTTGDYAGNLEDMGWHSRNAGGDLKPVGTKQANAWGLHDMHGNVWEWCSDWYGNYPGGNVTDPSGPVSGANRVDRGGSADDAAFRTRSAMRDGLGPDLRYNHLGFRLALAPVR